LVKKLHKNIKKLKFSTPANKYVASQYNLIKLKNDIIKYLYRCLKMEKTCPSFRRTEELEKKWRP
jgi:hypothetical protein